MPYIKLNQVGKLKKFAELLEIVEWVKFFSARREMKVKDHILTMVSREIRNLSTEIDISRKNKNDKEKFNSKFR